MKKLLLLSLLVLISIPALSQEETKFKYLTISGTQNYLYYGVSNVDIDLGIPTEESRNSIKSMTQALNFLSDLGWSLSNTYTNTYEKMNKSVHFWILKKDEAKITEEEISQILNYFGTKKQ